MSNIQKSIQTIAGSITKIEFADILDFSSIGDANAFNEIAAASLVFNAGKNWREFEKVSGASFNSPGEDTAQGIEFGFEANGKTMLAPRELAKLPLILKYRIVLKITDGDGVVWLCGNKTEYLKFKYKQNSGTNRSEAKTIDFSFIGSLTKQISPLV
jgi:hypothetical protein